MNALKGQSRNSLIISADDFGLNQESNQNILNLIAENKVDRVAVLIEKELSLNEIKALLASKARIDLHLDFARESFFCQGEKTGVFLRSLIFLGNYFFCKTSKTLIEKQWRSQIEKFKETFARYPDGLNSHQHIHFFPPYFNLALKLAQEYSIEYFRFGKRGILKASSLVGFVLEILWRINRRRFLRYNLKTSDYLASADWQIKNLPASKTEVIFHLWRKEEFDVVSRDFLS